jgi:hypothetical protein
MPDSFDGFLRERELGWRMIGDRILQLWIPVLTPVPNHPVSFLFFLTVGLGGGRGLR